MSEEFPEAREEMEKSTVLQIKASHWGSSFAAICSNGHVLCLGSCLEQLSLLEVTMLLSDRRERTGTEPNPL